MSTQIETETPQVTPPSRISPAANVWVRRMTTLAPVWTLLALVVFFSLASDSFLRPINLRNILAQISTLALFTTGMTFVMLCGEIDLSIAEIAGLSGTIATTLYANMKVPEPWPILAAIGVATLLGLINGVVSTRFRIPTLMTTLAMGLMAAGLNNYVSKGRVNNTVPPMASFLGSGKIPVPVIGDMPVLIIVAAITLLIGHFVLRYTRFGRYVYMTGASKPAARLAGVNTDLSLIAVMTICGFTAGLGGDHRHRAVGRIAAGLDPQLPDRHYRRGRARRHRAHRRTRWYPPDVDRLADLRHASQRSGQHRQY